MLNLLGRWKMFAESDLWKKIISFTCLLGSELNGIFHWQAHRLVFPSQHLVHLQVYLYCELLKKAMYHQQIFCIMKLCHLVDHLYKLEIKVVLTPIVVLHKWFVSTLKFDHLKLKVVQLERHMLLTYIRDYHARPYQML